MLEAKGTERSSEPTIPEGDTMSNIIIAAHEAFDAARGIVQEGINRKEWAHPMLAELDAKRVSSYREDLELLERVAKKPEDKKVVKENLKDFEALIRQANWNVQRANSLA